MMSVKISKIISAPVSFDGYGNLFDSLGNTLVAAVSDSDDMDDIAATINDYDSNQSLIAKLKADNELLREALTRQRKGLLNLVEFDLTPQSHYSSVDAEVINIDKALAATGGG